MILLNGNTEKLTIQLAGSVSANPVFVVASWADSSDTAFTPNSTETSVSSTSATDIVPVGGVSTNRMVKSVIICNTDSAAATVTIRKMVDTTPFVILTHEIPAGESYIIGDEFSASVIASAGGGTSFSAGDALTLASGTLDVNVDGVTINVNGSNNLELIAFTGDSGSGGTKGAVPAPASGDAAAGKYLSAAGTWSVPAGGGSVTTDDVGDDSTYAGASLTDTLNTIYSDAANLASTVSSLSSADISDSGSGGGPTVGDSLDAIYSLAAAAQPALTAGDGIDITSDVISVDVFTGDSGSGGALGAVPAPSAGDAAAGKYLDADGTWTVPSAAAMPGTFHARISASGASAVPSADVTSYAISLLPWQGETISLYDGTNWQSREVSDPPYLSATGLSASTVYDIFAVYNGSAGLKSPTPVAISEADTNTVAYPSEMVVDDVLLLWSCNNGSITPMTPTGFTSISVLDHSFNSPKSRLSYRIVDGTESGSVTASNSTDNQLLLIRGCDTSSLIDASFVSSESNGAVTAFPNITTVTNNALVVRGVFCENGNQPTVTNDSGWFEFAHFDGSLHTKVVPTAGLVSDSMSYDPDDDDEAVAFSIALKPDTLAAGVRLEAVAWSSGTARATALATQDGVLVKSGDATRRYVGSLRTTASTQILDTTGNRLVVNRYNRVARRLFVHDSTSNWSYSTAAFRPWNNSTNNRVGFLNIDTVDVASLRFIASGFYGGVDVFVGVGIGLDSTTTNHAQAVQGSAGQRVQVSAEYFGQPGLGYHYLQLLESGGASTATFYGVSGIVLSAANGFIWG